MRECWNTLKQLQRSWGNHRYFVFPHFQNHVQLPNWVIGDPGDPKASQTCLQSSSLEFLTLSPMKIMLNIYVFLNSLIWLTSTILSFLCFLIYNHYKSISLPRQNLREYAYTLTQAFICFFFLPMQPTMMLIFLCFSTAQRSCTSTQCLLAT